LTIGMEYNVGTGGRRLTSVQRQKLGMARAIIRQSTYYVFNRPLPGLDNRVQTQIVRDTLELIRKRESNASVIWVLSNNTLVDLFDRVLIFDRGKLAEDGPHSK